jgi:2'-5' RNA ligase superfamily
VTDPDRVPPTALIVAIPAAEPVIGQHRARLDANAALGVPAHVTVLFPFAPVSRLDEAQMSRLRGLFAAVPAFDVLLDRTAWFGTSVLWLGPNDPAPFRNLTSRVFAAFPEFPPYEGQFDDVAPHVTVGEDSPVDDMRRAEAAIAGQLPIAERVTAVTLIAESSPGSTWQTLAIFPLA